MIPPKAVLLAELERVLPKPAARAAAEEAIRQADGKGTAFPRHLERALARHLADEDVQDVLSTLGYRDAPVAAYDSFY